MATAAASDVRPAVISFFSRAAAFAELSNFHVAPFSAPFLRDDGGEGRALEWPTVEHYFQAHKFPSDPEYQQQIRRAPSPAAAKKLGASRAVPIRADWDAFREVVMRAALRAKFGTHRELREKLLSTGDAHLEEANPRDAYWGKGASGAGRNRLGCLLMELRDELRRSP